MERVILQIILLVPALLVFKTLRSQPVPTVEENIPYIVTFGGQADKSWGDDDFSQVFFFVVPLEHNTPVYFRVYDPDTGGELDEGKGEFDTKVKFTVYGGKECYSNNDAKNIDPVGNYKCGNLLASKIFGDDAKYDKNWYTFGPFNPAEGERVDKFNGYIFKIIAEGISGDDGNLYRYYMSTGANENKAIEGGNAFTYEYTFRLWDNPNNLSHIYPYVDDEVVYVKQTNFDWDNDGYIRIVSVAKNGIKCEISGDNDSKYSVHKIVEEEKNTSFDFQFVKSKTNVVKNNNVVVSIENQDGEMMPFYTSPIGGVPQYKYKIGVKKK
ncbi:MAG: hypothetical protein KJ607_03425 [Bacteroidetes bacterium]|nr:hypothetical protein [Bacteroidota bacterium]